MPAPQLAAWQNFYMLIGGASATLIGAMFVVVSLGIGVLTRDRVLAIRTFLSSTVLHLGSTLLGCAVTLMPGLGWRGLAVAAGAGGFAGVCYTGHVLVGFRRHEGTVRSDWLWYAILPLIAYAMLLAVAATAWREAAISLDLLAGVLAFLLVAGVRNAWDMIVFLVLRDRSAG